MCTENKTIYDFDPQMICDYFATMQRQGPGSPEATLRALSFIDGLSQESLIADLGCGTGGQTRVLAAHTPARIVGLDLYPDFIDIFNRRAAEEGFGERVHGIAGSMDDLPFRERELDVIWSEGAIYNIGFERGLSEWRRYLKPGGYLAVTESSWFADQRPAEIEDFWTAYPEMDTLPRQVAKVRRAGYLPLATFILPETCWTEHYFAMKVEAQRIFLAKYPGNAAAEEFCALQRREVELYRRYKAYYGYVFFIARKVEF